MGAEVGGEPKLKAWCGGGGERDGKSSEWRRSQKVVGISG